MLALGVSRSGSRRRVRSRSARIAKPARGPLALAIIGFSGTVALVYLTTGAYHGPWTAVVRVPHRGRHRGANERADLVEMASLECAMLDFLRGLILKRDWRDSGARAQVSPSVSWSRVSRTK